MKTIGIEVFCQECSFEKRFDYADSDEAQIARCPACGAKLWRSRFITCDCGTTVYLDANTNECEGCGALYNGFGQSLPP